MSKSRRSRRFARALLTATAGSALAVRLLAAQEDDESLRRRLEDSRQRMQAADSVRRALARRPARQIDTAFINAGPLRIGMLPRALPRAEQQSLMRGIERGIAMLEQRHGATGRTLLDTKTWYIDGREGRLAVLEPVMMVAGTQDVIVRLARPIDEEVIAQAVLEHAGSRLGVIAPAIRTYVGTRDRISLSDEPEPFERSGRELAVSWGSPARRCYAGSLADCRRVLTAPSETDALTTWFDATDHQAVVIVASGEIPLTDTTRRAQRERCVDGDIAVCTQLATTLPVRNPSSTNLRTTIVREAFALGDSAMPARLRASSDGDPVDVLARAAGVSTDSLLRSWVRHSRTALDEGRSSAPLLLLCAAGWSALLLALLGRKRPT